MHIMGIDKRRGDDRPSPTFEKGLPQLVPSKTCLSCDVCCRFPEQNSFLRPYFTQEEIAGAIDRGIDPVHFSVRGGCQIEVVPDPAGEGFVCPAFDSETSHCRIYEARPLDCQIYPFTIMWDADHTAVVLGWDQKCPFMMTEARAGVQNTRLIPEAETYACHIYERLEREGPLINLVVRNPHLVTPYQEDVVVVARLETLTQHFSSK